MEEEEDEDDKGGAVVGARLAADTAVRQVPVTSIWLRWYLGRAGGEVCEVSVAAPSQILGDDDERGG